MSDWQNVIKATSYDRGANIAQAKNEITQFETNTLEPEINAYLETLPAGQMPSFNIEVNPKVDVSGMTGDTYTIGNDTIPKLGNDANLIRNELKSIYTNAKYQVNTSMKGMGKTLKVTIPKTVSEPKTGKTLIDQEEWLLCRKTKGLLVGRTNLEQQNSIPRAVNIEELEIGWLNRAILVKQFSFVPKQI